MKKNLQEVRSFSDIAERVFREGVAELGFSKVGLPNHIAGHGMNILLIKTADPEQYTRKAALLNEYAKSCAPKFEQPIVTEDRYVLLVSEWQGGAHAADLLPYDPKAAARQQKTAFLSEVARIADAGLEHPYAALGFAHWRINIRSGSIVLTDWENAEFMASGSRERYLESMRELLEL